MKKFITLLLPILFFSQSFAQPSPEAHPVSEGLYTPTNLVQNAFQGSGINIINVTYTGDDQSIGFFKDAQIDLGIDDGFALSSGKLLDAFGLGCDIGPCQNTGNNGVASTNTSGGSDPDLEIITSGASVNNASVIEIEFIPQNNTIFFNYVFASEEYQNYTCSNFNDAMGIFLSGPGISGAYSNGGDNIALIPGTSIPVSINTVNSGVATGGPPTNCNLGYSSFFIDNVGNTGINVEYSGFTVPLSCQAAVVPGETYTLKIAVGDTFDSILDTSIFLEGGSFNSNIIDVDYSYTNAYGYVGEECQPLDIILSLDEPTDTPFQVPYTITGVAQENIDFTISPSNIIFLAGQQSTVITIDGIQDNMDEGIEQFDIELQLADTIEIISVSISDALINEYDYDNIDVFCTADSILLSQIASPSLPDGESYFESNSNFVLAPDTMIHDTIMVSGISENEITDWMSVDVCINATNSSFIYDYAAWLISPNGLIIPLTTYNYPNFSPDGGYYNTCFSSDAEQSIEDGAPPFTGTYLPEGDLSNLVGSPTNGTWVIVMHDKAAGFEPTFEGWSISFNTSPYDVDYVWSPQSGLDCATCPEPMAAIDGNQTYFVTMTDSYGCIKEDSVVINVLSNLTPPSIDSATVVNESCDGNLGSITLHLSGDYDTIIWDTGQDSSFIDSLNAGNYTVTVENECGETDTETFYIAPGLTFTLDTTFANCETGTAMITGPNISTIDWSNGETGMSAGPLAPGMYAVTVSNVNCSSVENFEIVPDPNCSSSISGTVYLEFQDNDCTPDNGISAPNAYRLLSLDDSGTLYYDFTDSDGGYEFADVAEGTHTITLENYGYGNLPNCPPDATLDATISYVGFESTDNDFWLAKADNLPDLDVSLSVGLPRPEYPNIVTLFCPNQGNVDAENTIIYVSHPPEQTFVGITGLPIDATYSYDMALSEIAISIPTISPAGIPGSGFFYQAELEFMTPITAMIGDVYTYSAAAINATGDADLSNNSDNTDVQVVNSYDPNNKVVNPMGINDTGDIPPSQRDLTYTINFQNEGTADAINVRIEDAIDLDVLEFTSIEFLDASHDFKVDVNGNNQLMIQFDDIYLAPQSESEEDSKGYITFSIRIKEGLPLGTTIRNEASIFFDNNPPIITNEAMNTIQNITSVNEWVEQKVQLFPNPSKGMISITSMDTPEFVRITDPRGQLVKIFEGLDHYQQLDVTTLDSGVYFAEIRIGEQVRTIKFVMIR